MCGGRGPRREGGAVPRVRARMPGSHRASPRPTSRVLAARGAGWSQDAVHLWTGAEPSEHRGRKPHSPAENSRSASALLWLLSSVTTALPNLLLSCTVSLAASAAMPCFALGYRFLSGTSLLR
eukprot:6200530-Pleurochrysis_carterae.AAC.1